MTDAEKMREAAAQACDRIAGNTADFGRDYRRAAGQCAAMIRALPIPTQTLGDLPDTGDMIADAIISFYGERCPDFEPECPCCKVWAEYDRLRALPIPDASAQIDWGIGPSVFQPKRIEASDTRKEVMPDDRPETKNRPETSPGVTAGAPGLLDNLRREISELKDQIVSLNVAAGMADTLEAGLQAEIALLRAERLSPGLLEEVKAADRIGDVDMAMLQSMAISFRARMGFSFNPDDMADLLTRVSAALARLEREAG